MPNLRVISSRKWLKKKPVGPLPMPPLREPLSRLSLPLPFSAFGNNWREKSPSGLGERILVGIMRLTTADIRFLGLASK